MQVESVCRECNLRIKPKKCKKRSKPKVVKHKVYENIDLISHQEIDVDDNFFGPIENPEDDRDDKDTMIPVIFHNWKRFAEMLMVPRCSNYF